jgi:translation initiation factor IF-3
MILNEKNKSHRSAPNRSQKRRTGHSPDIRSIGMPRQLKVDLVCTSLLSSPPPARLTGAGAAKQKAQQTKKREQAPKLKEIRLTPQIEDHDYETILKAGDAATTQQGEWTTSAHLMKKADYLFKSTGILIQ